MTASTPISLETLEQHVQACLAHLYDYTFLQSNQLVHLLVPDLTGPDRVEAFRNLIIESVERLRPGANVAFHSKAARTYNILSMRYVAQESTSEVIKQLALSERQFYRDHTKAVRSVSGIFWERLTGTVASEFAVSETAQLSMQTEVQRLSEQSELEELDLGELLAGAVSSMQPLAQRHEVSLILDMLDEPAKMETQRTLLRQLVLAILSQLVIGAGQGATVQVSTPGRPSRQRIIFTLSDLAAEPDTLLAALDDQETLQLLVKPLKATLHYSSAMAHQAQVFLELATEIQTVLIVDDNPDAIDLFHRYLAEQSYQVLSANNGAEAIQLARDVQPNVIILDIMLPGQDGLEVLQNLKHHELTRHIPILVCSILDMQPLALSLGADDYLKKPPGQMELLSRLDRWRA